MANNRCSCGRVHKMPIKVIEIGEGVVDSLPQVVDGLSLGRSGLVVADQNTWEIAGERVVELLQQTDRQISFHVFKRVGMLIPDEQTLGELLLAIPDEIDFLVGVGSGTISDLVRYISKTLQLPFLLVPTAPSMDGYASSVSPLIQDKHKRTFPAYAPRAIIADLEILRQAPSLMVAAGIGDLLGKITAKADWLLAHLLTGEYRCEQSQLIVDKAVKGILNCRDQTDSEFTKTLIDGLINSGIAISMVGNSRPASGSEHHLAHFWENQTLGKTRLNALHGHKVGVATLLILEIYARVFERIRAAGDPRWEPIIDEIAPIVPTRRELEGTMRELGALTTWQELEIDKSLVLLGLQQARHVRDRYTVLSFASQQGWLDEVIAELTY